MLKAALPRARSRALALALGLLVAVTLACAPPAEQGRVLLVGIDGANLRVASPLLQQGKLPNLARIARDGIAGPLQSFQPLHSPRIWNTIATGKKPEKHGILTFFYGDEGDRHLFLSTDRKAHALWNIAGDRGLGVGVVNWWTTYPPTVVDGIMLSDHFLTAHIEGLRKMLRLEDDAPAPLTWPVEWEARAAELHAQTDSLTPVPDPFHENEGLPRWIKWLPRRTELSYLSNVYREDTTLARVALAVDEQTSPDLLMVLFPGIDRVSHVLWGVVEDESLYPPGLRPTPSEREIGLAAVHAYYAYTDALIGLLVERFSNPGDSVVVVSDHGFEAGKKMGAITGEHETMEASLGVVFARGPRVKGGASVGSMSVNDVTPMVLALLGLPRAADMDGVTPAFVDAPSLPEVASYDGPPIEHVGTSPSGAEADMIERLRALGYGD